MNGVEVLMHARVLSLNIGRPRLILRDGKSFSTAINRTPIEGAVELGVEGFAGDRVSNTRYHGGPDKAVCVYPSEHYPFWREQLGTEMPFPSFGENLTTLGLLEAHACIGDTFRIGTACVQITQPRQPCGTLAGKHNEPRLVKWVNDRRWTGFYLRVLEPGAIRANDAIEPLERDPAGMTVAHAMEIMLKKGHASRDELNSLLAVKALSDAWRKDLQERFDALT